MKGNTSALKIMIIVLVIIIVLLTSLRLIYTTGQYRRYFHSGSAVTNFIESYNHKLDDLFERAKDVKEKYNS